MLVLTRKTRETIQIGNEITVTILRIKGATVRVGIEAPRTVRVVRGELPLREDQSEVESDQGVAQPFVSAEDAENPSPALGAAASPRTWAFGTRGTVPLAPPGYQLETQSADGTAAEKPLSPPLASRVRPVRHAAKHPR